MNTTFAWYALLAFFSSLSVNLILQCGFGMAGVTMPTARKLPLLHTALCFITVLFLWLFFTYILSPLALGFFGYILFFPVASVVYNACEHLLFTVLLKRAPSREDSNFFTDGLPGAALFLTYNIAGGFIDALLMAAGFSAGLLLILLITGEINRRSEMEAVPRLLSGRPLILVSMGLLSLVFGSVALICYRILGV